MTTRKRIRQLSSGAAGGISPIIANVAWGPDFGDQAGNDDITFHGGVNIDLSDLALSHNRTVGVNTDISDIALSHNRTVGVNLTGSALGAPFFQGVGVTTQTASSTSVVMTPDTTANDGDFLIVTIGSASLTAEAALTSPTGWTHLRTTSGGGATPPTIHTFYKFAGVGEASSYTFTGGNSAAHVGTIIRLTAVNTSTPINVEAQSSGSAADPVSPSITTTTVNCFMLSVCMQSNALNQTYTPPAGYVERSDHAGTSTGITQVTSESATRVQAASGASGTQTHDSNQIAASNYVCHHVAIAPGSLTIA